MPDSSRMLRVETHAHTSEISTCSHVLARDLARLYCKAEYDVLFIVDHLNPIFCINRPNMPPATLAHEFFCSYREASSEGEKLGIRVLPAFELRCTEGNEDYLVYGIDEAALSTLGPLPLRPVREAAEAIRSLGGVFLQAHPFRNGMIRQDPSILDGCEVHNGHPNHDSRNHEAIRWALAQRPSFIRLAGSDCHAIDQVGSAGVFAPAEAVVSTAAFAAWLRANPVPQIFHK